MFRFLGDEDDDVSGAVAQFSQEYIALLKQTKILSQKQRENMEVCVVLKVLILGRLYLFIVLTAYIKTSLTSLYQFQQILAIAIDLIQTDVI